MPEIIDPLERAVTRCVQRGFKGRRWGNENQRRGSIWHQRRGSIWHQRQHTSITMPRIMIDPGHPSDANLVGITLPVQTQTILDKAAERNSPRESRHSVIRWKECRRPKCLSTRSTAFGAFRKEDILSRGGRTQDSGARDGRGVFDVRLHSLIARGARSAKASFSSTNDISKWSQRSCRIS